MGPLLAAIGASQVNTRRSAGYIFARADGVFRQLWDHLRNARKSSPSDVSLRQDGWKTLWADSVRAIMWTDAAEEKWRRANPTLPLEPHLNRRDAPQRILEDDSSRQSHTTPSSPLMATPDAPRRSAAPKGPRRMVCLSDDHACQRWRLTWASKGRTAWIFAAAISACSITIRRQSNRGSSLGISPNRLCRRCAN
jgi:hypothetical protein